MKTKLEYGKDHAKINGATHHRNGDIYKVYRNKVLCWIDGGWTEVHNCHDLADWIEELTEIDWESVK